MEKTSTEDIEGTEGIRSACESRPQLPPIPIPRRNCNSNPQITQMQQMTPHPSQHHCLGHHRAFCKLQLHQRL